MSELRGGVTLAALSDYPKTAKSFDHISLFELVQVTGRTFVGSASGGEKIGHCDGGDDAYDCDDDEKFN